ncbi:ABC transporter permease [Sinirhodobacter huangdaonensis]|jgi:peptide/nickel transport system permease protein|uniref:ABC transporter permease n=1 Tax=Paenirhodobacter huangdaonensis TaxID=2501515 RepID=A0A3S3MQ35_9RHOB|nr:ABC transporter permease [Sinirhodobacter huangdaonensis]RWR52048.1 ABC transporter permease [Sinirhodobacter huangdaonensis]
MFQVILKRLVMLIPVLIGITLLGFLLLQVMPGDPASRAMGTRASPEELAAMRKLWGLDQPLWVQYLYFLRDCLTGSFGVSIFHKMPVIGLVAERLPYTLAIVAYSTLIALAVALPFAILAALRRGTVVDGAIRHVFVALIAMPPFWLCYVLILWLALGLGWFPTGGVGQGVGENLYRLFLPSLVVGLSTAALIQQSLRAALIDTLKADYVDTARAKGLSGAQVFTRHVLPNSLISTISIIGVRVSWIIGGTVVVEKIFSVPGLGSLLIDAIVSRDLPVIRGLTVFFAIMVVIVNLVTDICYALADPRVRLE